ncbi:hypothetical protein GA0115254_120015 [Streptomyces sp. Ncost-T10-10d]|nr:hypothetical protein GA0115254_120015 [Streptomyces sp. Ncost-T10-10d]
MLGYRTPHNKSPVKVHRGTGRDRKSDGTEPARPRILLRTPGMNRPNWLRSARTLVERRVPVAAEALASPATGLRSPGKAPAAFRPLRTTGGRLPGLRR